MNQLNAKRATNQLKQWLIEIRLKVLDAQAKSLRAKIKAWLRHKEREENHKSS